MRSVRPTGMLTRRYEAGDSLVTIAGAYGVEAPTVPRELPDPRGVAGGAFPAAIA